MLLAGLHQLLSLSELPQPHMKFSRFFHSELAEILCFPKPALHVAARCFP